MTVLNEVGFDGTTTVFGADTVKVEKFIEDVYVDAWKRCTAMLPTTAFKQELFLNVDEEGNDNGTLHADEGKGTGYVVLPSDYWMLGRFKMTGWKTPVFDAIVADYHVANVQANEYTRGNFMRPVCVLSKNENGKILEYYSLPRGVEHIIDSALYIPIVSPLDGLSGDTELGHSDKLQSVLVYNAATLVLAYFEKTDAAKMIASLLDGLITK